MKFMVSWEMRCKSYRALRPPCVFLVAWEEPSRPGATRGGSDSPNFVVPNKKNVFLPLKLAVKGLLPRLLLCTARSIMAPTTPKQPRLRCFSAQCLELSLFDLFKIKPVIVGDCWCLLCSDRTNHSEIMVMKQGFRRSCMQSNTT